MPLRNSGSFSPEQRRAASKIVCSCSNRYKRLASRQRGFLLRASSSSVLKRSRYEWQDGIQRIGLVASMPGKRESGAGWRAGPCTVQGPVSRSAREQGGRS
jgi:hypothetical protein